MLRYISLTQKLDTSFNQSNIRFCRYEFLHNCGNAIEDQPNNSEVTTSSPPPPPPSTPRIREDVRDQHCKTLRLALHVWLDQFPEDFRDPPNYPCLSQLEAFCQKIMPGSELDEKVVDFIAETIVWKFIQYMIRCSSIIL